MINLETLLTIKVYLQSGAYRILSVLVTDDVKTIANNYERWEYVL